ncbi:MAG: hypothetical protein KKD63_05850 [Proteobacteria bacterium]|nr:hypothetical protein [Desulfobulbaceae bacterium]MBU4152383.1 hypothetical protein [Pseudomonadota bacterium]
MSVIELISFLGGSSVLLGAVAWLIKSLTSQFLAKELENHKSQIQFQNQIELAKIKYEIEKIFFEHQVVFSKLHEKQAEILAGLYASIVELYDLASLFVSYAIFEEKESRKEKSKELLDAVNKFRNIYEPNIIFFPETVCVKIKKLDKELLAPVSKLIHHLEIYEQNDDIGPARQAWEDGQVTIEQIVFEIKNEIEVEFRKILGVKFQ